MWLFTYIYGWLKAAPFANLWPYLLSGIIKLARQFQSNYRIRFLFLRKDNLKCGLFVNFFVRLLRQFINPRTQFLIKTPFQKFFLKKIPNKEKSKQNDTHLKGHSWIGLLYTRVSLKEIEIQVYTTLKRKKKIKRK